VERAQLLTVLDNEKLLINLQGIPHILLNTEFCLGSPPPLVSFHETLSYKYGENIVEVEVTVNAKGLLSANSVYDPPREDEQKYRIEFVSESGLIITRKGCRVFVPTKELVWTWLNEDQMKKLFKPGDVLTIVHGQTGGHGFFSYIKTDSIRQEFELLVNSREPVYISREILDLQNNRAIVRTRLGMVVEMILPDDESIPVKTVAYFKSVDYVNHRIVLSLSESPPLVWDFPKYPNRYIVDALTYRVIGWQMISLRKALGNGDIDQIVSWFAHQNNLEPGPRNMRLILEEIYSFTEQNKLNPSLLWDKLAKEEDQLHPFIRVWCQMATALKTGDIKNDFEYSTHFSLGYWWLINDRFSHAETALRMAYENLTDHFDVGLCLARSIYASGKCAEATEMIRLLLLRLWTNAAHTLDFPIFDPPNGQDTLKENWIQGLKNGNLEELKTVINKWEHLSPGSIECQSQRIWLAIARGEKEKELNEIVDEFIDLLKMQEVYHSSVDPHLISLAAKLSFTRGRVETGLWYMSKIEKYINTVELRVFNYWSQWAFRRNLFQNDVDPLFKTLWALFRQARWRSDITTEVFDDFWCAFRHSPHRWTMHLPICHAVQEYPNNIASYKIWAANYGEIDEFRKRLEIWDDM
jgi:hypothetical protein